MGSFQSLHQPVRDSGRDERLHIAIVGAGIGGLALAIALNHQGISYTIYEAAGQYATVGAGVGIGPNAMVAMDLIDKRFRSKYDSVCIGNLTPGKEHVMMEAAMIEEGLGTKRGWKPTGWGSQSYTRTAAHRKQLLDIMTSFIPIDTVRFHKRVAAYQESDSGMMLHFSDGDTVKASAVIGCDGIKGGSRAAVLSPSHVNEIKPKYAGQYAYRAVVPIEEARAVLGDLVDDAKMYCGKNINLSTYVISEGREINLVAFVRDEAPWPDPDKVTREVSRERMLADFAGHDVDQRLLKLLDWAKPVQWAMFHHPQTSTYFNGLTCLLGDSAHASLPNQAAGAGQALEDALIMSRVLAKVLKQLKASSRELSSLLKIAFEAYDSVRRPRAQRQIETSVECGQIYSLSHPNIGHDMIKTVDNLNHRFDWLWLHDLLADVQTAEKRFDDIVGARCKL